MPSPRRVVVTGVGQVSSLGTDLAVFRDRVRDGRPGVSRLPDLSPPGLDDPIGAAVPGFDPHVWLPGRPLSGIPRVALFALAAAIQAMRTAGLALTDRARGGLYVGTGFGGIAEIEETYRTCFAGAGARPRPAAIPTSMANSAAGFLASELRLKGPNLTFCVACSSGSHAIGQAFHLLRAGGADLMLAGGADAPLTPIVLAAWNVMRVLAPAGEDPALACRPFSADRSGLVVGEGAAFLVLETLEHASGRGAIPLAEVVGYGANADAGHLTHPDPDGISACIGLCLADAGLVPAQVGYVNAHGTGTEVNDRVEADVLAAVFGPSGPAVSSTKAVTGHAMGAAGALEAVATVLALRESWLPPTANVGQPDPRLAVLDHVLKEARDARVEVALSNSFAFGGNNAVLALRRFD